MRKNKQYIIFVFVLILLIISVVYRVKNPFIQNKVKTLTYTGKKNKEINFDHNSSKIMQTESGSILSRFLNRSELSGEINKDLFSLYKNSGKLNENAGIKNSTGKITQARRNIAEGKGDDNVSKVIKDILRYRFYGSYKSENKRAVFLVKEKLVLVASTGDRIDGKYLIKEIQDNYIQLKALDINETIHIDMREFNNE